MTATIVNIIIATILGIYAIKQRNKALYLLFILFLYISLHYSYSFITIIGLSYVPAKPAISETGSKVVGLIFLVFISGLLLFYKKNHIFSAIRSKTYKYYIIYSTIWIVSVCITWTANVLQGNCPTLLSIQNIISCLVMLILTLFSTTAISDTTFYIANNRTKLMLNLVLVLLFVMNVAAIYQIVTLKTFAGFLLKDQIYIRRASALLFNPNLLGIWCAFVAAITAYGFHAKRYPLVNTIAMFLLVAFGILASGSRSGLLICLFILTLVPLLHLRLNSWPKIKISLLPLFFFLYSLTGIGATIKIAKSFSNNSINWLSQFSGLVDRFIFMPQEVYMYAIYKFTTYLITFFSWLYKITGFNMLLSSHKRLVEISNNQSIGSIFTNIDGRLNADLALPDNGFLAMFNDAGWLGLLTWGILWLLIIMVGFRCYAINKNINSIYALSTVSTCLFSAIFIRSFQLYPVWIMISIALGISMSWIEKVISQKNDDFGCDKELLPIS